MANVICKKCGEHRRYSARRGTKLAEMRSPCCNAPLAAAFYGYLSVDEASWGIMERTKENIEASRSRSDALRELRLAQKAA